MRPQARNRTPGLPALLWDLLTFDRLVTGPVIHLIYWAGLAVVALFAFSVVGAAVGLALKEPGFGGVLLGLPVLVAGMLVVAAMVLIWRSFCEFYVAIFRISDDLRVLRLSAEREMRAAAPPQTATSQTATSQTAAHTKPQA